MLGRGVLGPLEAYLRIRAQQLLESRASRLFEGGNVC
jgi:hypothetical protein